MKTLIGSILGYILLIAGVKSLGIEAGFLPDFFTEWTFTKLAIILYITTHVTITAMSLSFHRFHTHGGVKINGFIDFCFQIILWFITGMAKRDWVAIHRIHHQYSDTEKDPHSPAHKGLARIFFLGVYDYVKAKEREDVLKVKNRIPVNAYEAYIERHPMLGPSALMIGLILLFGALWGTILAVSCYLISPLFAVGGVNALAHFIGYQNHFSRDNSRNLGFLFPLNFAICGELDHNNHHAYQRSCSFRHRWFEFDIGYFYIKLMSKIGLAKIVNTYNPELKRKKIMEQVRSLLEHDFRFQKKIEDLSKELNTSYADLAQKVEAYLEGQKVKLDRPIRKIAQEIKRTAKINVKLQLSY